MGVGQGVWRRPVVISYTTEGSHEGESGARVEKEDGELIDLGKSSRRGEANHIPKVVTFCCFTSVKGI